jgi:hypothetical protein
MVWNYSQYNDDEEQFREQLLNFVGMPKIKVDEHIFQAAVSKILNEGITPPPSMMDSLQRVISTRREVANFCQSWICIEGYLHWISYLTKVQNSGTLLKLYPLQVN